MKYTLLLLSIFLISTTLHAQSISTEIIFWHYYPDERGQVLADLIEEFNQSNTAAITVKIQYFPGYDQMHDAALNALINGGTPNVILVRNHHAALYQLSGALVDLTPYAADLDSTAFYPLIWEQDIYHDQRLGIPLTRAYQALYINLNALHDLGYESPPTTRAEMGEMACKYKNRYGYDIPAEASFYLSLAQPLDFFQEETFHLNTPEFQETIRFLQDQIKQGCAVLNTGTITEAQNRFAAGEALFYFDSSGAQSYIEAAIGDFYAEPFDLAAMPMPGRDQPIMDISGSSLSIFHHDDAQDQAAWALIEWLAQPEQIEKWAQASHTLPARRDVDPIWGEEAEWMIEPNFPGYDVARDEIVFASRAILTGAELPSRLDQLDQLLGEIYRAFVMEQD